MEATAQPMTCGLEWGPLGLLAGDWQGEGGLDRAYSHTEHRVLETPFLESLTFKPFGPVQNGRQALYGLDYRSAMWRGDEVNSFHTETGYWLWDGSTGEIVRCFVVPRGIAVTAGGTVAAGATSFTLEAAKGHPYYAIGENAYLAEHASTLAYTVTVTVNPDGSWSYDETTTLAMDEFATSFAHTDHNTLRRAG